jgi:hypothetical protein
VALDDIGLRYFVVSRGARSVYGDWHGHLPWRHNRLAL